MRRRKFIKVTGAAAAMSTCDAVLARTLADRPNLLVIHTDEQNFRTLGCYRKLMPNPPLRAVIGTTGLAQKPLAIEFVHVIAYKVAP